MNTFNNLPSVKYEGAKSKNSLSFKQYNPEEIILGKTMREHLRFAMSYWHTMCSGVADMFGGATIDRTYGKTTPMEIAKARADEAFLFLEKLDIDYFCFHDADIMPDGAKNFAEHKEQLAEITDYIKVLMEKTGKKLLWGTANLFSHPRYMQGAGTSPDADIFAYAAATIKNAVDATIKLGGQGYVFWGGREGYETLLNTNMGLELDNMARLMKMTVEYARSKGFDGDFYIEPKPKEPSKHQYDFDAATAFAFLQKYGLAKDFKMNIEANHATLAGHTFEHELRYSAINGIFGSVDANQGDLLLGWDTDQFPSNIYDTTACMLEVLRAGGFTNGGLNFDAKVRRPSYEFEDIAHGYICGMDAMALGLRKAAQIMEDGRIDEFVTKRYASWQSEIGQKITQGQASLEDLEAYTLAKSESLPASGRQEYLESVLNQVMFNG